MDANNILTQMLGAAENSLKSSWDSVKDLAIPEFKKLAQNIVDIEAMKIAGTITEEKAQILIDMQKNTLQTVLLTEKELGLLAVEAAINAALDVVSGAVNKALGWNLL